MKWVTLQEWLSLLRFSQLSKIYSFKSYRSGNRTVFFFLNIVVPLIIFEFNDEGGGTSD
jgi:hypothetical protein